MAKRPPRLPRTARIADAATDSQPLGAAVPGDDPAQRARDLQQLPGREPTDADLVAICERIAGGDTASAAARALGVSIRAVYPALARRCPEAHRAAREAQVSVWMDAAVDDRELCAQTLVTLPDGRLDPATVQLLRLRVTTRQWVAERVAARIWGSRTDVTSGGERIGGVVLLPPEQPAPDA